MTASVTQLPLSLQSSGVNAVEDDISHEEVPNSVIVPPPDIKKLIDVTASWVAEKGTAFEGFLTSSPESARFSFIKNTSDLYHNYYRWRIAKKKGITYIPATAAIAAGPAIAEKKEEVVASAKPVIMEPPPPEKYTLSIPLDITALELDVIRLTAQFAARQGQEFLIGLAKREERNPTFDFLKPFHYLNSFFHSLLEGYTACLLAPKNQTAARLRAEANEKYRLIDKLNARLEYARAEKRRRDQAAAKAEAENFEGGDTIDWNDFVVVQVIDFEDEAEVANLSAAVANLSTTPTQQQAAAPAAKTAAPEPAAMEIEEEGDVDMEFEETVDTEAELRIVKNYVPPPKAAAPVPAAKASTATTQYQICPKCGQRIPIEEMAEHMKMELYQRPTTAKAPSNAPASATGIAARDTVMASDDEVARNLRRLAEQRNDIFDKTQTTQSEAEPIDPSEAARLKRLRESVIWDGHTASISKTAAAAVAVAFKATTATPPVATPTPAAGMMMPPPAAVPGYPVPPMGVMPPPPAYYGTIVPPPRPPPVEPSDSGDGIQEPPAKRQKTEAPEVLLPAEEFALKHGAGEVRLVVKATPPPASTPQEWGLAEAATRPLEITAKDGVLGTTVARVKELIKDKLGGKMPTNKMKLKKEGGAFLKDTDTLAAANIGSGAVLVLSVKERGGRR